MHIWQTLNESKWKNDTTSVLLVLLTIYRITTVATCAGNHCGHSFCLEWGNISK
jgi:hypothetical protein